MMTRKAWFQCFMVGCVGDHGARWKQNSTQMGDFAEIATLQWVSRLFVCLFRNFYAFFWSSQTSTNVFLGFLDFLITTEAWNPTTFVCLSLSTRLKAERSQIKVEKHSRATNVIWSTFDLMSRRDERHQHRSFDSAFALPSGWHAQNYFQFASLRLGLFDLISV